MDVIRHIFNAGIKHQRCHGVRNPKREVSGKFPKLIKFNCEIPDIPRFATEFG